MHHRPDTDMQTPSCLVGGSAVVGPAWRHTSDVAEERGPVALRPRLSPGVP